jgi:hypothetical protein
MKLKTKLMMFTAALALSANMAMSQTPIDAQALADAYIAEGYTYVEVKVGPTQTKLEAVKGDQMVEMIYDTATGALIKQEFEDAEDDYIGRTGIEIETSDEDFEDDEDDEDDDEDADDVEGDDDDEDDDDSDEDDDDEDDEDDDDSDEDDDDDDSDDGEDSGEDGN